MRCDISAIILNTGIINYLWMETDKKWDDSINSYILITAFKIFYNLLKK